MSKVYEILNCNPLFTYFQESPYQRSSEMYISFGGEIRQRFINIPKKLYFYKEYDKTNILNYPIKVTMVKNNE